MNRAIFIKTAKDTLPVGLLTGIGTIGFVVLFVFAMVNMGKEVLQFIGLVSAMTNRRGTAITIVVAVALVSATLNFVEPFISVIKQIRFIGLLHYFRPVDILRIGAWPWNEILALSGFGIACWVVGTVIFCRKDIPVA